MTRSLLILGCGGHGRVVADTASECGYEDIAFLDDRYPENILEEFNIIGSISAIDELVLEWPEAISAVGNSDVRVKLFLQLRQLGYITPNIIHPSAIISRRVTLEEGIFIAPGAIINNGTSIGSAAIVNTGARIDHDCVIGAGVHIAPGVTLSGNVTVEENAWLGTGSAVRQSVTVGYRAIVGVGAAVVSDLQAKRTYVGVPARPLQE